MSEPELLSLLKRSTNDKDATAFLGQTIAVLCTPPSPARAHTVYHAPYMPVTQINPARHHLLHTTR